VGNQTPHPVRIALLQRFRVGETGSKAQDEFNPELPEAMVNFPVTDLKEPVHWDFEPGEGSYQGLILSLPEGDLALNPGDVLVAFAQDEESEPSLPLRRSFSLGCKPIVCMGVTVGLSHHGQLKAEECGALFH
jgi:hypothetical protein